MTGRVPSSGPSRSLDSGRLTQPIEGTSRRRLAWPGSVPRRLGCRRDGRGRRRSRSRSVRTCRFPSSASAPRPGGSKPSRSSSASSPPTPAWRSCSSSTSTRRTRASSPSAGQGDDDAGRAGRGRQARRAEPRLRHPAQRGRLASFTAAADARAARRRSAQAAPARRFLLPRRSPRSCGSQAIGVVLSGTASDGTEGLRAIKARRRHHLRAGSRSRRSSAACRAARSTPASSTTCLPIPELARELVRLSRHPYVSRALRTRRPPSDEQHARARSSSCVRNASASTSASTRRRRVERRLARRMALRRIENLRDYLALLAATIPRRSARCTRTSSSTSPRSSGIRRSSRA